MAQVLGIRKRLLYLRRVSVKKAAVYLLIPVLYVYLPLRAALAFTPRPFLSLLVFYLTNFLVFFFMAKNSISANSALRHECEELEEKLNLQLAHNSSVLTRNISLKENINRFANLKKVIERVNHELDPDSVCESLCESAFGMIASQRGTCILYLADSKSRCLRLHKTRKEDRKEVIKAKQGDLFDHWVAMHMNPLLVEDTASDFRFDPDSLRSPDRRHIGSLIGSPLASGGKFLGILRLDHPDANFYNLDDLRFLRAVSDLGALALENALLYSSTQELAIHDGLTGACTKAHFLELLSLECRRSLRSGKKFGLLMLDIDHFKKYNDTFGHIAGDIVLKTIAEKMAALLRDRGAIVGRFGGEEFCVILPSADRRQAVDTAGLIREAVEKESFVLRRKLTPVTVSVGVAVFPETSTDETELMMRADKAMYEAKQTGRNRVV